MNAKLKTKHVETTAAIAAIRAEMGERLWKITIGLPHNFLKKEAAEKVRACKRRKQIIRGSKSLVAATEIVIEAAELLREAKRLKGAINRHAPRGAWRAVDRLSSSSLAWLRKKHLIVLGSVVHNALNNNYRLENTDVDWGDEVEFWTDREKDWDYYSKRTRYPKTHHTLCLRLDRAWRDSVYKRGLMLVDDIFTLYAGEFVQKDGARVFAARWLQQARGYDLREVEGFIAHSGGVFYHAKTEDAALRGVRRKIAAEAQAHEKARFLAAAAARRDALLEKAAGVWVTFKDARATGACAPGIENWCMRAGIDPAVGADGAQVVEAYKRQRDQRALLAVFYAMRRQRAQHGSELAELLA